jgi:EpsI family protein
MPATKPDVRMILVPLFLLAQGSLVHWAAVWERAPAAPALSSVPSEFDAWRKLREDPIAADVAGELRADKLLSRTYVRTSTGSVASLFVAWFQSQRSGRSQPHSPKVCLPASGWTPAVTGKTTLDISGLAIVVNRYIVVSNRGQRDVVLYWYQGRDRVAAGEWETKLWLIAEALRDRRSDVALVRVVVPSGNGGDEAASAEASAFARSLYPLLRENLPQ